MLTRKLKEIIIPYHAVKQALSLKEAYIIRQLLPGQEYVMWFLELKVCRQIYYSLPLTTFKS